MSDGKNSASKKRAVLLAGGKGTRLRPYTLTLPKPLVPIGDLPILEIVVRQLAKQGFQRITMAVNHQADLIKAYFKNGDPWRVEIDYSLETSPLGTMGPLRLISDLPENFLVMNGDILTDLPYDDFFQKHVKEKRLFSISSYTRQQTAEYGVIETNSEGRVVGFREKPSFTFEVSMGIYMLSRDVLEYIPQQTPFGFDTLMGSLLQMNKQVFVSPHQGYWMDIGRPDDYAQAVEDFPRMKSQLFYE